MGSGVSTAGSDAGACAAGDAPAVPSRSRLRFFEQPLDLGFEGLDFGRRFRVADGFVERLRRTGTPFDNVGRLFVHGDELIEAIHVLGQTARRGSVFAADGDCYEIGKKIAPRKQDVDAALRERHLILTQEVAKIFEFVRQALNVRKAEHAAAALDRMQRAEERVDDLGIGLFGGCELFELEQIAVDLLQ